MLLRLPDSPTNAKFLTEEERAIAIERMRANQTGYKNTEIDCSQILEAFTDPKTWILAVLILACNIPNGGFTTVSIYMFLRTSPWNIGSYILVQRLGPERFWLRYIPHLAAWPSGRFYCFRLRALWVSSILVI